RVSSRVSNVFTRVVNAVACVWPLQSLGPLFARLTVPEDCDLADNQKSCPHCGQPLAAFPGTSRTASGPAGRTSENGTGSFAPPGKCQPVPTIVIYSWE